MPRDVLIGIVASTGLWLAVALVWALFLRDGDEVATTDGPTAVEQTAAVPGSSTEVDGATVPVPDGAGSDDGIVVVAEAADVEVGESAAGSGSSAVPVASATAPATSDGQTGSTTAPPTSGDDPTVAGESVGFCVFAGGEVASGLTQDGCAGTFTTSDATARQLSEERKAGVTTTTTAAGSATTEPPVSSTTTTTTSATTTPSATASSTTIAAPDRATSTTAPPTTAPEPLGWCVHRHTNADVGFMTQVRCLDAEPAPWTHLWSADFRPTGSTTTTTVGPDDDVVLGYCAHLDGRIISASVTRSTCIRWEATHGSLLWTTDRSRLPTPQTTTTIASTTTTAVEPVCIVRVWAHLWAPLAEYTEHNTVVAVLHGCDQLSVAAAQYPGQCDPGAVSQFGASWNCWVDSTIATARD